MRLVLTRTHSGSASTIGTLEVGDFKCFTCEDEHRDIKVSGETRIPAGEYEIQLRKEGKLNESYSQKYDFHKHGMLWLKNVPGFEWIYIHVGNSEKDTLGCILVGMGVNLDSGGGTITRSVEAYRLLYPIVSNAILSGEKCSIVIQ